MSVQSFTNLFISTKCLISFPLCYLLWGSLCLNKPIKPQYKQGLQILLMSGVSVTSASQILETFWNNYLESSIRLSSTWWWHVYTIVRDTWSSCGGLLTWKAQIHDGSHRVSSDRNLPFSCFVVQYNSLISMIKVTPSVTSVESSGQCWRKICQIWRICEPWNMEQGRQGFFWQEVYYYMTGIKGWLNWTWTTSILCGNILQPSSHAPLHFQTRNFDQSIYCINIAKLKLSGQHIVRGKLHQHSNWHVPGQINHTFCKEDLGVPQMIEMKCSLRPG